MQSYLLIFKINCFPNLQPWEKPMKILKNPHATAEKLAHVWPSTLHHQLCSCHPLSNCSVSSEIYEI